VRNPDSVKARLKQIAIAENIPFDYLLTHYFIERMIYRLSVSAYADNFILKGGLLLYTILENDARVTRDVDFLARRLTGVPDALTDVFRAICMIESDDAVRFDPTSVTSERIKEGELLHEAVRQTLKRRGTPLSDMPAVFSDEFSRLKDKQIQWQAFQKRIRVAEGMAFADVISRITVFLRPIYLAVLSESMWTQHWNSKTSRWE
jgi:hypothetical protein